MDAVDHGRVVLGSVFAYLSRPALDFALSRLTPDSFTDQVQANLFVMAERCLDRNHVVLTRAMLADVLREQPPGTALKYQEYYDSLCRSAVPGGTEGQGAFLHSVDMLREMAAERRTGEAFATAVQILRQGRTQGSQTLRGHEDARGWVVTEMSQIERDLRSDEAPEGLMNVEMEQVFAAYVTRKAALAAGRADFVPTGLAGLDRLLGGGLERGELDIVGGWTSSGKTSFIVQLAWHAAVMQGKFVVLFTTETLRNQVRIKILARHSALDKFGLGRGLNSADIKAGRLTPAGERAFQMVAADFSRIQGGIYVAQLPKRTTIDSLEGRLERITRQRNGDLCIIDYLQLLTAVTTRRAQHEESASIVKDAKSLATTYRRGHGIPVVSPWQISKAGYSASRDRKYLALQDFAETKEATDSADVVIGLMAPDDYTGGRYTTVTASLLKNRDGESQFGRDNSLLLDADYATSSFTEKAGTSTQGLLSMPGDPFGGSDFG